MSILPVVPAPFRWSQEAWGAALRCVPLEPIAPHLFTTRQLELTAHGGERSVCAALGAEQLAMLSQVHGTDVVTVRDPHGVPERTRMGDALTTNQAGVAIAVRVADCVPILIADRATGAVAAVHAGWRGTAAGAAVAAVNALQREFGCRPAGLTVAIGPSIGACCYEVGPELVDAFAAAGHGRLLVDRWFVARPPARGSFERPPLHLDLVASNRDQLVLAGIPEDQIHACGLCTAMHLDVLTSYRVERAHAGRMAGVITVATDRTI
jgi:YfiH family protein